MNKGTNIYICVGGHGNGYNNRIPGIGNPGPAGGGATSITTTNKGELSNFNGFRSEVLLVAGGGGAQDAGEGTTLKLEQEEAYTAALHLGQVVMVVEQVQVNLDVMGIEILQKCRTIIKPALGMVVSSLPMKMVGKTMVLKVVVDILVVVALKRPDLLEVALVILKVMHLPMLKR
ncbi:hypothetical protein DW830_14465 [Prevotella sp. AM34-19LB]|nr:hypothetical protein DW830_14465 [Prevotella sp. AM34-19LB]